MKTTFSIRLDKEDTEKIDKIAEAFKISRGNFIRECIERRLKELKALKPAIMILDSLDKK